MTTTRTVLVVVGSHSGSHCVKIEMTEEQADVLCRIEEALDVYAATDFGALNAWITVARTDSQVDDVRQQYVDTLDPDDDSEYRQQIIEA